MVAAGVIHTVVVEYVADPEQDLDEEEAHDDPEGEVDHVEFFPALIELSLDSCSVHLCVLVSAVVHDVEVLDLLQVFIHGVQV